MNTILKFKKVVLTGLVSVLILGLVSCLIWREVTGAWRIAKNSCKESVERELSYFLSTSDFKSRNSFDNEWTTLDDEEAKRLLSGLSKARTTDCYRFPNLKEGRKENGDFVSVEVMRSEGRLILRIRE